MKGREAKIKGIKGGAVVLSNMSWLSNPPVSTKQKKNQLSRVTQTEPPSIYEVPCIFKDHNAEANIECYFLRQIFSRRIRINMNQTGIKRIPHNLFVINGNHPTTFTYEHHSSWGRKPIFETKRMRKKKDNKATIVSTHEVTKIVTICQSQNLNQFIQL